MLLLEKIIIILTIDYLFGELFNLFVYEAQKNQKWF